MITAKKDGLDFTWRRQKIGNIIDNVPKLIKLEGGYKKIKIMYENT